MTEPTCISETILRHGGAWRVLVHAHDAIWHERAWPFRVRYEATKQLWNLSIEVHKERINDAIEFATGFTHKD